MDKPLTDQELAQQYEQQLAAGIEERRALRLRLKRVRGVISAGPLSFPLWVPTHIIDFGPVLRCISGVDNAEARSVHDPTYTLRRELCSQPGVDHHASNR